MTGILARKDGKNWITVTRAEPAKVNYPARMLAPDQPFLRGGEPLTLKINDELTLNCIFLPAGRFLRGPRSISNAIRTNTLTRSS